MKISELVSVLSGLDPEMKVCVCGLDGFGWADFEAVEVKLVVEQGNKGVCDYVAADEQPSLTGSIGDPFHAVCIG